MRIKVKAKHIKEGKQCSTKTCPVALALRDAGYQHIEVGSETVEIKMRKGKKVDHFTGTLPKRAVRFIDKFDRANETDRKKMISQFKPFEFTLKLDLSCEN
jgi:hypothetical protein